MSGFSVVTNIGAVNAQANLATTNQGLQKALTRLSTGLRINNSGDDAAGLSVANAYRSDTAIINQGIRNANDGMSSLEVKDSALSNISSLVERLGSLAAQAASGNTTEASRITLDTEFQNVLEEIARESAVAETTANAGFSVFVSAEGTASNGIISGTVSAVTTTTLTLEGHVISTQALAESAVGAVSSAVAELGGVQGTVGTLQNRLNFAISLAKSQVTNNITAESRIRDADIAQEAANLTKFQILSQSGLAALAQANSQAASVLSLLQ